jgi:hypothetical protein
MANECRWCHGCGWWSSGCDGQVECDECGGFGYHDRGNCTPCDGTGWLSRYGGRKACAECGGTGDRASQGDAERNTTRSNEG